MGLATFSAIFSQTHPVTLALSFLLALLGCLREF
jgi:hypothetical protein